MLGILHLWRDLRPLPHGQGHVSKCHPWLTSFQLVCGEVLSKDSPNENTPESDDESKRLQDFPEILPINERDRRRATDPRDYVLTIWSECPRYGILEDYRHLAAGRLLEDALNQLESNFKVSFATNVPPGLFSPGTDLPLAWRPSLCYDSAPIQSSSNVHIMTAAGSFPLLNAGKISGAYLPLHRYNMPAGKWLPWHSDSTPSFPTLTRPPSPHLHSCLKALQPGLHMLSLGPGRSS